MPICTVSNWMYPGPWIASSGLSIPVLPVAPPRQRAGEHRVPRRDPHALTSISITQHPSPRAGPCRYRGARPLRQTP